MKCHLPASVDADASIEPSDNHAVNLLSDFCNDKRARKTDRVRQIGWQAKHTCCVDSRLIAFQGRVNDRRSGQATLLGAHDNGRIRRETAEHICRLSKSLQNRAAFDGSTEVNGGQFSRLTRRSRFLTVEGNESAIGADRKSTRLN